MPARANAGAARAFLRRWRNQFERCFDTPGHFRAMTTGWEKRAQNRRVRAKIAGIRIRIRAMHHPEGAC